MTDDTREASEFDGVRRALCVEAPDDAPAEQAVQKARELAAHTDMPVAVVGLDGRPPTVIEPDDRPWGDFGDYRQTDGGSGPDRLTAEVDMSPMFDGEAPDERANPNAPADATAALEAIVDDLPAVPAGLDDPGSLDAEIDLLAGFVPEHRAELVALDDGVCAHVLEHLVARYRRIHAAMSLGADRRKRIKPFIESVHDLIDDHDPGYVHGLPQKDTPAGATWTEDAQRRLARLHADLREVRR